MGGTTAEEHGASLDDVLRTLGEEPRLPPLPPLGLGARAYASVRVHRAVPDDVALELARLRATALWRLRPEVRATTTKAMRYLLGCSERADEVEALGLPHLVQTARRSELHYRPWQTAQLPVSGAERIAEHQAAGRGVLVSFLHHGFVAGLFGSMVSAGAPRGYLPVGAFHYDEPSPGLRGRRDRRQLLTVRQGARCFSAAGSFDVLVGLLRRRQLVYLATDMPGRTPATWLGREVLTASGTAKVAVRGDAVILPTSWHDDGRLGRVTVDAPIDVRDFDGDVPAVVAEVLRRHEPAVLAWPEAVEWPLDRSTAATAEGRAEFGIPWDARPETAAT